MNAFHFGDSAAPLLGVYHAAAGGRRGATLLCYPFGHEYLRAHRAFRRLAAQLAREGHDVLRFDYRGTGDSAGDAEDGDPERWIEDIATAARELEDMANVERISIVGLGLGAALALEAARRREDVEQLVLWNPVVNGRHYLEALTSLAAFDEERQQGTVRRFARDVLRVRGFAVTDRIRAGLDALALGADDGVAHPVTLIVPEQRADWTELGEQLRAAGTPVSMRVVPDETGWSGTDDRVTSLVPQPAIDAIVSAIMNGAT